MESCSEEPERPLLLGNELIISDDHEGLGTARRAVFGSVPWQKRQFHFQLNAGAFLSKQSMRLEGDAESRVISNETNKTRAEELLPEAIQMFAAPAPRLFAWLKIIFLRSFRFLIFH